MGFEWRDSVWQRFMKGLRSVCAMSWRCAAQLHQIAMALIKPTFQSLEKFIGKASVWSGLAPYLKTIILRLQQTSILSNACVHLKIAFGRLPRLFSYLLNDNNHWALIIRKTKESYWDRNPVLTANGLNWEFDTRDPFSGFITQHVLELDRKSVV